MPASSRSVTSREVGGAQQRVIAIDHGDVALAPSAQRRAIAAACAGALALGLLEELRARRRCRPTLSRTASCPGAVTTATRLDAGADRGADHVADDRQAADRVQHLGRCRAHAGALARRQNDRQQFCHARPVIHARFRHILWQQRVGKPLHRRDGKLPRDLRFERLAGLWIWRS